MKWVSKSRFRHIHIYIYISVHDKQKSLSNPEHRKKKKIIFLNNYLIRYFHYSGKVLYSETYLNLEYLGMILEISAENTVTDWARKIKDSVQPLELNLLSLK